MPQFDLCVSSASAFASQQVVRAKNNLTSWARSISIDPHDTQWWAVRVNNQINKPINVGRLTKLIPPQCIATGSKPAGGSRLRSRDPLRSVCQSSSAPSTSTTPAPEQAAAMAATPLSSSSSRPQRTPSLRWVLLMGLMLLALIAPACPAEVSGWMTVCVCVWRTPYTVWV